MDITEDIPFSIPANWKWVRIRDVFQLNPKNEADNETLAAFIPMEKISAINLISLLIWSNGEI